MFLFLGLCTLFSAALSMAESTLECPHFYTKMDNHCFFLNEESTLFYEAITICQAIGGRPAEIRSQKDQDRVKRFLETKNVSRVWFGLSDIHGSWIPLSANGQADMPTAYMDWAPGFPKDKPGLGDDVHCAYLSKDQAWRWQHQPCTDDWLSTEGSEILPSICEARLP